MWSDGNRVLSRSKTDSTKLSEPLRPRNHVILVEPQAGVETNSHVMDPLRAGARVLGVQGTPGTGRSYISL